MLAIYILFGCVCVCCIDIVYNIWWVCVFVVCVLWDSMGAHMSRISHSSNVMSLNIHGMYVIVADWRFVIILAQSVRKLLRSKKCQKHEINTKILLYTGKYSCLHVDS